MGVGPTGARSAGPPGRAHPRRHRRRAIGALDHLVVTAPVLSDGVAWVESVLGVPMQAGGRHVAMGTHNVLLRLDGSTYLEVIAIDPDAPAPSRPRWFGLDALGPGARPRLTTWVARVDDLDAILAVCPEPMGDVVAMERGPYAWRSTIPADGRPVLDGLVPALIAWSTPHPALGLTDHGCRLVRMEARHPDPGRVVRALRMLDLHDLAVEATAPGEAARLMAIISTDRGLRRLGDAT